MGNKVYEGLFPSFSEFVGSTTDDGILSEKEVPEDRGKTPESTEVNLLIGNFQPVTMGHIKAARKLKEKNGHPVVLVAVTPEKQTAKFPFSTRLTKTLMEKVKQEYSDLIIDIKMVGSSQIEEILEEIHPGYAPILWGTSERRVKDYALQLEYIKKKKIPLRLAKEFKLVELPSFVKSEDVLKSISTADFAEFKKQVPTSVVPEFYNLQKELQKRVDEAEEKKSKFGSILEN
jgi:cytidyltransferase-like protein